MLSIQARENLDTQPTGYRPISFRNSKRVLPAGERLAQWNLKNNNGSSVQYRNDVVFPGHGDPFDSKRLHELASDYISKAGPCHKIFTTLMKGLMYMILKAKTSRNIPANCCFHACCCCCCFM